MSLLLIRFFSPVDVLGFGISIFPVSYTHLDVYKRQIQWFASKYANAKDVFFIGRGIDYAISLEGSQMCIRDRRSAVSYQRCVCRRQQRGGWTNREII